MNSFNMYELPEITEDIFNKPMNGSKFLGEGTHQVILEEISAVNGNFGPQIKAIFKSDSDKIFNAYFNITRKDKSGKEIYHWLFTNLLGAVSSKPEDSLKFLRLVKANLENVKALTGFGLEIDVVPAKKGYTLVKVPFGGVQVNNLETNELMFDAKLFLDYTDAQTFIETHNLQHTGKAIKKGYPQLNHINPRKDKIDANTEALQSIIQKLSEGLPNQNSGLARIPTKDI